MLKRFDSQRFLRFSLIFVLVASLRHVAWAFGTMESGTCTLFWVTGPCSTLWGYAVAIAFDMGVVALGYGVEQAKKDGRSARGLWAGIIILCAVSTYANMLYGLVFSSPVQASADWPRLSQWMVYAKPFVLSGILPVMLVYISHITASYGQAADRPTWPPIDVQLDLFVQQLGDVAITPDEAARRFTELTKLPVATTKMAQLLAARNLKQLSVRVNDGATTEGVQGGEVVQQQPVKIETLTMRNQKNDATAQQAGVQQDAPLDTATRRARVQQMAQEGMSQQAMADELGVNRSTIKRDLDALAAEAKMVHSNGKVRVI